MKKTFYFIPVPGKATFLSFFLLFGALITYGQGLQPVYTVSHNITWGFNESRLTRFMDCDGVYAPGSGPYKFQGYRNQVLDSICKQGIHDIRFTYLSPFDVNNEHDLMLFVKKAGFDTNNNGLIDNIELRNALPSLLTSTFENTKLNQFNLLLNLNDIPFNPNLNSCHKDYILDELVPFMIDKMNDEFGVVTTVPDPDDYVNYADFKNLDDVFVDRTKLISYNKFYPEYFNLASPVNFCLGPNFNMLIYRNYLNNLLTQLEAAGTLNRVSFEIGNEADLPDFFGTAQEYLNLSKEKIAILQNYSNQGVYIGGWTSLFMKKTNMGTPLAKIRRAAYRQALLDIHNHEVAQGWTPSGISFHIYPNMTMMPGSSHEIEKYQDDMETMFDMQGNIGSRTFLNTFPMNKSIISEYNLTGGYGEPDTPGFIENKYEYVNSEHFVYEFAKLIKFATEQGIEKVYMHSMMDGGSLMDGEDNYSSEQAGFFNANATPKESWNQFKKVHDILKEGYTLNYYKKADGSIEYVDIVSNKKEDFTNPSGKVTHRFNQTLRVSFKGLVPVSNQEITPQTFIERFDVNPPVSNTGKLVADLEKGSWIIFRGNFKPVNVGLIVFTPNPVACQNVTAEWENLHLNIHAQLRIEIRNLLTGEILYANQLNREARSHAIDVCNFVPGQHVATLYNNGVVVAQGNLMVSH